MKHKTIKFTLHAFVILALFLFSFNIGFAQGGTGSQVICQLLPGNTLVGLIDYISCILGSSIIGLIFSLAFVYFFWGVVQYVLYPDDEGKKDKGR
ncbi:MAG: hypothetical protein NTW98_03435, partial [Candidatus Nomurabacteria bacterium]|nr:hypothetical protein [Candidatus Nomurabacteria bacterium]